MSTPPLAYGSRVSSTYDQDRANESHWASENDFIAAYFSARQPARILDIPVGTGRFLHLYPKNAEILGVDLSTYMVEQAQAKLKTLTHADADLRVGSADKLDFLPANSIDVVVCCRLFHLIKTPIRLQIMKELTRVLHGEIILQVYLGKAPLPFLSRVIRMLRKMAGQLFKKNKSASSQPWRHIKSYRLSREELEMLCTEAGLKITAEHYLEAYEGTDVYMFQLSRAA